MRRQRTLAEVSELSGIGLHTGEEVNLRFCPAKEDTGILFRRIDIPGGAEVPATIEYVQDTSRSTNLGVGDIRVLTVEHVLAAIRACNIDNLIIEVSGAEPPVGDGSSMPFLQMIERGGIKEQGAFKTTLNLRHPVFLSEGHIHMVAVPSSEYRISYTLHYPESEAIRSQYYSKEISEGSFKEEIAPSRTFSRYDEVSYLIDRGLIKGGSLDNAVVVMDDAVLCKEGLRYSDEMVRHKVLDLIGDLSLVGMPFNAHIMAIRSGHATNIAFAKKIFKQITMENV